jgi:regulator of ribonuclease activity A
LCDACDGVEACTTQFRGYGVRRSFGGSIRTVRCDGDISRLRDIANQPGRGHVLVLDNGGSVERAVFGDVMASLLVSNGWAGVVVNGAIRDIAEISAMDIGVKAVGSVSRRGDRNGAGAIDVRVTFGGVDFEPGRYLVADEDGVVLLPAGSTEEDIDVLSSVAATAAYAAAP